MNYKPKYKKGHKAPSGSIYHKHKYSFEILEAIEYTRPIEVLLPDGREYKVYGHYKVYSHLAKSVFWGAIMLGRLAGKWRTEVPFNSKVAIDMAKMTWLGRVCSSWNTPTAEAESQNSKV